MRLGWLRQELDDLDPQRRLLDAVEDVATYVHLGTKELSASQLAERLGFSPKRQRTPVGDLSGGERRRLQLTRVLMSEPNVLLLDEPTNDLDIDTLQELESLLDEWPGTLVVVSHDRYLIERITDAAYALFGDGNLQHLPGGIEQYLQVRAASVSDAPRGALDLGPNRSGDITGDGGSGTSATASSGKPEISAQQEREITKAMRALERKMDKLEKSEAQLDEKMAEAAEDVDTQRLTELNEEKSEVARRREELEAEWLELADQLDAQ